MRRAPRCAPWALAAVVASAAACDPEGPCNEPVPSGEGALGESCITSAECVEGLACIGESVLESATCSAASGLPGGADPGCVEHAEDWEHHQADGVRPITTDDEGCEILIFESACNCTGSIGDGGCLPTYPLYRQETWRSCTGCCWRLVALWIDAEACEEP